MDPSRKGAGDGSRSGEGAEGSGLVGEVIGTGGKNVDTEVVALLGEISGGVGGGIAWKILREFFDDDFRWLFGEVAREGPGCGTEGGGGLENAT